MMATTLIKRYQFIGFNIGSGFAVLIAFMNFVNTPHRGTLSSEYLGGVVFGIFLGGAIGGAIGRSIGKRAHIRRCLQTDANNLSPEDKFEAAETLRQNATKAEIKGRLEDAFVMYQRILDDFSNTEVAMDAAIALKALKEKMDKI